MEEKEQAGGQGCSVIGAENGGGSGAMQGGRGGGGQELGGGRWCGSSCRAVDGLRGVEGRGQGRTRG